MTDAEPTREDLDALSTEELRERAFARARERHDAGFFVDLVRHLPAARAGNVLDDSSGSIGEFVDEVIGVWREFTGHSRYGEFEPMIRARFLTYLTEPTT